MTDLTGNESPENPQISVIVVTWNCAEMMADCLHSLYQNAGDITYEVIVIDNASADNTVSVLKQRFPEVKVTANKENLGFAKANNQGMKQALAPLICLLNPDTLVQQPDTLLKIQQQMDVAPEIGAAGCRLTFPDGRHQVGDAGGMPTLFAVTVHAFFINKLFPTKVHGLFLQDGSIASPYGRVAWVCGACTILRQEIFQQTGGFDESYFLYGEDVEWGSRMTAAGIYVAYLPDISIVHLQGGTQKGKDLPSTRWIDGVAKLFFEHNRGRHWYLFRAILSTGFLLRFIIYSLTLNASRGREMLNYSQHIWKLRRLDKAS